jgi:hypothetical protein
LPRRNGSQNQRNIFFVLASRVQLANRADDVAIGERLFGKTPKPRVIRRLSSGLLRARLRRVLPDIRLGSGLCGLRNRRGSSASGARPLFLLIR